MTQKETILFFEQLALLVRTGLPLPQSLHELAASMPSDRAAEQLRQLGQATAEGASLSTAMDQQATTFRPFQIALVEVGEQSGFLAATLRQIAEHAKQEQDLLQRLRQAIAYPAVTLYLALVITGSMCITVVPNFAQMFDEMMAGEPLPPLTVLVIAVSDLLIDTWPLPLVIALLIPLFLVWLLTGHGTAERFLRQLLHLLPGYAQLDYLNDYARLCGLLAIYLRHGLPLDDALTQVADTLHTHGLAKRVRRWQKKHAEGQTLSQAVIEDKRNDPLVVLALKNAPEDELPDALTELAEQFRLRSESYCGTFASMLSFTLIILTSLAIGGTVLAMFMPLIKLIDTLGG